MRSAPESAHREMGKALAALILAALVFTAYPAQAQKREMVQEFTGHLELNQNRFYTIPKLQRGQDLYVYMEGASGNLDPFVAILKPGVDITRLEEDYLAEEKREVAAGRDVLDATPEILKKFTLAWDDESGRGYSAALKFKVPQDGDYQLVVLSSLSRPTFGDFRLWVGVNAPQVLTGKAKATGDVIAIPRRLASKPVKGVEEPFGTLTPKENFRFYPLRKMRAGETLYVYAKATSGNLKPNIVLYDYGEKPLARGEFLKGQPNVARFSYTFDEDEANCRVKITGLQKNGSITTGDFQFVVGINAPEVLTGQAVSMGQLVLQQPTPVQIGLKLQQITGVDQKSENFSMVGSLALKWQDPDLAFKPDTIQNRAKIFTGERFLKYANDNNILVPEFTIYNQQGRRWTQNSLVVVWADGKVEYFERFTATLQAPDFDFRKFPFDTQKFFILIDNIFPEWFYVFTPLEGFSEVGDNLGEEEWVVTKHDVSIESVQASMDRPVSRFSFGFTAQRHITYFVFRILLPLMIIIVVSWFSFFLKDYSKRVDVAGANLLVFIAFNFTISGDLPRLGYLTFLDTLMATTFIITGIVVVIAYQLRRMVIGGKEAKVHRIDKYIVWFYPVAYIVGIVTVTLLFG
ncbi:MAG: hypothetical protein ABIG94_03585 [Pseudomonadota bacterium]